MHFSRQIIPGPSEESTLSNFYKLEHYRDSSSPLCRLIGQIVCLMHKKQARCLLSSQAGKLDNLSNYARALFKDFSNMTIGMSRSKSSRDDIKNACVRPEKIRKVGPFNQVPATAPSPIKYSAMEKANNRSPARSQALRSDAEGNIILLMVRRK